MDCADLVLETAGTDCVLHTRLLFAFAGPLSQSSSELTCTLLHHMGRKSISVKLCGLFWDCKMKWLNIYHLFEHTHAKLVNEQ